MIATVKGSTETQKLGSPEIDDLFDQYLPIGDVPSVDWISRLKLDSPRRNVRCLGKTTLLVKRLTDVIISMVLLIVLSPVLLLVAIAVRVTSRGPIIYRQTRVGLNLRDKQTDRRKDLILNDIPNGVDRRDPKRDRRCDQSFGKPFTLYKFRTMKIDAERDGAQFAVKNDPRMTCIGWFLRRTRLDETPQLWNVLRGEMTLVGPRPERPEFIKELTAKIPNYINRLGLKPGLTGLAQVVNGYDNNIESFRRKVQFDLLYLQNCCLWNDLKILLRTIRVVLTGSGAI